MILLNPVLLALIVNSAGFHLFGTPPSSAADEESKYPRIIFATAVCVLFAYCRLFENLFCRPSPWPFQFIWKFLAVAYVLEQLIAGMWIPFEVMVSTAIPELADSMEKSCDSGSVFACAIFRVLDVLGLLCATSVLPFLLATIFFLCSLHMTDLVDIGMLRCLLNPRRLLALLLQYVMSIVGIKTMVCEEGDLLNSCRSKGNGCGGGGGGGAAPERSVPRPTSSQPCRKPMARAPTPSRR